MAYAKKNGQTEKFDKAKKKINKNSNVTSQLSAQQQKKSTKRSTRPPLPLMSDTSSVTRKKLIELRDYYMSKNVTLEGRPARPSLKDRTPKRPGK